MISALNIGVSGLNSFEKALNTQSNNVSNSSTIAHKKDEISFEDLMYQSRYGKGVNIQSVEKNFQQGSIQVTNNTLDVAIDGTGFFKVEPEVDLNNATTTFTGNEEFYYTRAGNFKIANSGYLENAYGNRVLGSGIDTLSVSSTNSDIQTFNSAFTEFIATEPISYTSLDSTIARSFDQTINARATDYTQTAVGNGAQSGSGYKSSDMQINDIRILKTNYNEKLDLYSSNPIQPGIAPTSQITQVDFANFDTELTQGYVEVYIDGNRIRQAFDSDPQTTMNLFADQISNVPGLIGQVDTNGLLTIESMIPGNDNRITGPAINENGKQQNEISTPTQGSGYAMLTSARNALQSAIEEAGAEFLEITTTVEKLNEDELPADLIQLKLNELSITQNVFGQLSIEDGLIYAKDEDNKFLLGRLETVTFSNPESLNPQGDTLYKMDEDVTGSPVNANNLNTITSGAVELSNSSYSESLVDLMVYQRAFEANSKSVTTADEFLRTAIELKK